MTMMKSYSSYKKKYDHSLNALINHIKYSLSLPEFIEEETGEKLFWSQMGLSAKCCCPFHGEDVPSFHVNFIEEKIWVYHCFGCGAKGNIIGFCQKYFKFENIQDAVTYICEKYKIEHTEEIWIKSIDNFKVNIDQNRILENLNVLFSNQCRILLRKNFDLHKHWVFRAYKLMNKAIDLGSHEEMNKLNVEAHKRLSLGVDT